MKKIWRYSLSLMMILVLSTPVMPAHADTTEEKIEVNLRLNFEDVAWQHHGQKEEDFFVEIYHYGMSPYFKNVYNLSYQQPEKKVELKKPDVDWGYSVYMHTGTWDHKYYDYGEIYDFDDVLKSQELVFDLLLKRTSLVFNLSLLENSQAPSYQQACFFADEEAPEDDGDQEPPEDEDEKEEDFFFFRQARILEETQDLSGLKFALYDQNDELVQEFETDQAGQARLDDLVYGEYKIKQISSLEGYDPYPESFAFDLDLMDNAESCEAEISWYNSKAEEVPEDDQPTSPEQPSEESPEKPKEDLQTPAKPEEDKKKEEPKEVDVEVKKPADKLDIPFLPATGKGLGRSLYLAAGFLILGTLLKRKSQ